MRRCKKCGGEFPATPEYFVTLTKRMPNGSTWRGLASECRVCRNKRHKPYYEARRSTLIARAIESTRKRRLRPEVQEQERISARDRKRRLAATSEGREHHNALGRSWRKNNPERTKQFKHEHPAMKRMRTMNRVVARLKATPPWVDLAAIEEIYRLADEITRCTGVPHEVDHIYPLRGKTCSGLHVPWNLRVIPAEANRAKGNKMPEEYCRVEQSGSSPVS